jgi:hypothetical protein
VPEDTYFGRTDISKARVELVLVIVFAIVGTVLLVVGLIELVNGSTNGPIITLFGIVFLVFVAYALAAEFDFMEGKGQIPIIYSGP